MKKYTLFILVLVFLAGCSSGMKGNENVNVNDNAAEFMSYGHENNDQGASRDKDRNDFNKDEVTEQNPNFLNLNTDNETHVNNKGMDVEKAKEVIGMNNQFDPGPIWINGQDMSVTVYPRETLTNGQRQEARTQLRKDLLRALPRYHINLKVQNR